jgi:hypothetical protein
MTIRALWEPGWYNLDSSLKVGRRDVFGFHRPCLETRPSYDRLFANDLGRDWDYRSATVVSIRHAEFGALDEVDAKPFGQYRFTLADGRWVVIEAEQGPGAVNDAHPDFPVDRCGGAAGWSLDVVLDDLAVAHPH